MSQSDRKETLLDSAENLIQRMGANAMSYQHLSEEVGIRKASIHYHYPRKEDLILALQDRCEQNYHERYQAIAFGSGTASEKLLALAKLFATTVRDGKLCVATMLNAEYDSLTEASREALKRTVSKTLELISGIIASGVDEGEFSNSARASDLAYAFFSFLMGGHLIARGTQSVDAFERAARSFIEQLEA